MDDLEKLFQPIDVGGIGFQPVREEPGGEQVPDRGGTGASPVPNGERVLYSSQS